jgi:4-amino-4-deoxy-L-arabinose transferase-like glycosyltransferase
MAAAIANRLRGGAQLFAAWAGAFGALAALHANLLRLPYYWDEAGYYIPAAYDFLRWGTLVPRTTLTNAHPPLPAVYLSASWRLFGFRPLTTRLAVCGVAALALLAVYRLARAAVGWQAALTIAALTAVYPVWFAQSTLAHADIFAACATLWALAMLLRPTPGYVTASVCFCVAVLSKETAVITPVALAGWLLLRGLQRPAERASIFQRAALLLLPAAVLACWYFYHWRVTGYVFGNPEYLRYNATGTLHLARLWFAVPQRLWHLAGHMNLWVAGLASLALWIKARRADAHSISMPPGPVELLAVALVANALAFSVLGGALLTRYLLPLYPLILLGHVAFWQSRTQRWPVFVAATFAAFVAGWTMNPPYQFAAEDNLSYAAAIRVEQQGIQEILRQNPDPLVLTTWPVSDYLSRPELGYVATPVRVLALHDLTLPSLLEARDKPFTTALLFTTINPQR